MQPCRIWDTQTQERGLVRDFVFDLGDEVHFSFKRATRQRCSISGWMDGWTCGQEQEIDPECNDVLIRPMNTNDDGIMGGKIDLNSNDDATVPEKVRLNEERKVVLARIRRFRIILLLCRSAPESSYHSTHWMAN